MPIQVSRGALRSEVLYLLEIKVLILVKEKKNCLVKIKYRSKIELK